MLSSAKANVFRRPALAVIISLTLGVTAIAQIIAISMLLLLGGGSPRVDIVRFQLSALDLVAIYVLASILLVSMKYLLNLRKRAVSWFSAYVGLGSWAALFYSFSRRQTPHFDELASLAGLLLALLVLAYLLKLKRDEVLK